MPSVVGPTTFVTLSNTNCLQKASPLNTINIKTVGIKLPTHELLYMDDQNFEVEHKHLSSKFGSHSNISYYIQGQAMWKVT